MSLYERVPEIDLSPEFSDGPLWAFEPRDYLRLLRDIAYFPQRARDYVLRHARAERGELPPPATLRPREWLLWLEHAPLQAHFLLMAALLGLVVVVAIVNGAGFLAALVAGQAPHFGAIGIGMLTGIGVLLALLAVGAFFDGASTLATFALPMGVALGILILAAVSAPDHGLDGRSGALSLLCLLCGIAFGASSASLFASASLGLNSLRTQAIAGLAIGLGVGITVGCAGWPARSALRPTHTEILFGDALALAFFAAAGFVAGALRVDDYLLHGRAPGARPRPADWLGIARVTPIPLPHLHDHLTAWLDFDWARGMDNAASIWWYTAQQETVRRALHDVLQGDRPVAIGAAAGKPAAKPEGSTAVPRLPARNDDKQADKVLEIVGRIADAPGRYPWDMVTYGNPSRSAIAWNQWRRESDSANTSPIVQRRNKRQRLRQHAQQRGVVAALPMKTPEQAVTAGFWYLDRGYIADALEAFKKAPGSPLAREMLSILEALNTLSTEENLLSNTALKLPERPREVKRKATWDALETVRQVVRFARLARQSATPEKRAFASSEASRLLLTLAQAEAAPNAELRHLQRLAELWDADLTEWLASSHTPEPIKPVENPFIFAEPLRKTQMFVGRERELAEIKLVWTNDNLQTALLFGPPLIGKTSLLYAARSANPHVELAWLHMGHSTPARAGSAQLLAAMCAAVQQATVLDTVALDTRRPSPLPAIEQATDPYAEAERFIRHACTLLLPRSLILVLDDFDALQGSAAADLPAGESTLAQFLGFLAHLNQMVKNFNVVFVSQAAPESFAASFGSTFAGTARLQPVGALEKRFVTKLLRPSGLPVYFGDEAVDAVLRYSGGHPYLVQLIAHTAVQRFNRLASEQKADPLQEPAEIDAAVHEDEFQQRAQALFRRMHQSAAATGPQAAALLREVAQSPYGIERSRLSEAAGSSQAGGESALDAALQGLARLGYLEQDAQGRWRFGCELWRRFEAEEAG